MRIKIVSGFTLVELLVSLTLGTLVLVTLTGAFSFGLGVSNQQLERSVLRAELQSLLHLMGNEIKRAGYCGDCGSSNPFVLSDDSDKSSLLLDGSAKATTGTCLRFAYNADSATNVTAPRRDDARGFRWYDSDRDGKKELEVYENHNALSNWKCGGSHWLDFNTQPVTITKLSFSRTKRSSSGAGSATLQQLAISITGQLNNQTETQTLTITVRNREG